MYLNYIYPRNTALRIKLDPWGEKWASVKQSKITFLKTASEKSTGKERVICNAFNFAVIPEYVQIPHPHEVETCSLEFKAYYLNDHI